MAYVLSYNLQSSNDTSEHVRDPFLTWKVLCS